MVLLDQGPSTMHDVVSDRIAWFTHRTKCGPGANWKGTSGGTEGDMMDKLLKDAKRQGFTISQIITDHDTFASTIATNHFPNVNIIYCGNHTAKTFHGDLIKIRAIWSKVRKFTFHYVIYNAIPYSVSHHVEVK